MGSTERAREANSRCFLGTLIRDTTTWTPISAKRNLGSPREVKPSTDSRRKYKDDCLCVGQFCASVTSATRAWEDIDLPAYMIELQSRVAFAWPAMDFFYEEDERSLPN
jgi:hypothetical protein